MLCAATFSNSYVKWSLHYVMLRFVAVPCGRVGRPNQRDHGGPAGGWNWGKRGLMQYKWKGTYVGSLFFPCFGCSGQPSTKYFFLTVHNLCVPLAQQPGQAVVQGSLSLNMCLWGQRHILRDRWPSAAVCPACWAIGTIVYSKYFVLGWPEQPRLNKDRLYRHDKTNKPTKEGPLSFVLFESPFTSVSTASRGHPSLVSLLQAKPSSLSYIWERNTGILGKPINM